MTMLRVENLAKAYPAEEGLVSVLDIPLFELEPAAQVALRGGSGTGKTTLLHCIAGILTPDTGTVTIDGEEMTNRPESQRDRLRARKIGYVYQTFNLLQGFTALENVMLGMAWSPGGVDVARARQLLIRVGLEARMHFEPRRLSVGQQQRVAIARALAHRPRLVLADEPTGNLDPRHASEALDLLREACHDVGASLLLVSHDRDILARFDTVIDLRDLNRALAPTANPASGAAA